MKLRVPMVVAMAFGALTLAAYFLPIGPLPSLRLAFVDWASMLAAVALLVGVLNLALVHIRKIGLFSAGWIYSLVLVLALVVMLGLGLLELSGRFIPPAAPYAALAQSLTRFAFVYIQTPLEASLAALLVVIMILAGARLFRNRRRWAAGLFIAVSVLLLFGLAPIHIAGLEVLAEAREWVIQVPAAAGARGILIGVALGAITTGLRVIIGADRPYGE